MCLQRSDTFGFPFSTCSSSFGCCHSLQSLQYHSEFNFCSLETSSSSQLFVGLDSLWSAFLLLVLACINIFSLSHTHTKKANVFIRSKSDPAFFISALGTFDDTTRDLEDKLSVSSECRVLSHELLTGHNHCKHHLIFFLFIYFLSGSESNLTSSHASLM